MALHEGRAERVGEGGVGGKRRGRLSYSFMENEKGKTWPKRLRYVYFLFTIYTSDKWGSIRAPDAGRYLY